MPESNCFRIRRVGVDSSSWTPIIAPLDASTVVLDTGLNAAAWYIRTDPNDSSTQRSCSPGEVYRIQSIQNPTVRPFAEGVTVCYVRVESGAGPVVAQFIR